MRMITLCGFLIQVVLSQPLFGVGSVVPDVLFSQSSSPGGGGTIDLDLDLYLPAPAPLPSPVLVLFHGGSYVQGDKREFARLGRDLSARGLAVVSMNYRLGTVADASSEIEAVSMVYADVLACFRWISEHAGQYGLDRRRVFVGGGSSGGHLTLATSILYPKEQVQPVTLRGGIDLYGGYFTEALDARCAPLLIVQGTDDRACLPEASLRMMRLYREAGAPCRMVLIEGMIHDWSDPGTLGAIESFIGDFVENPVVEPAGQPPLYLARGDLLRVDGGRFTMGSVAAEAWDDESPVHQVTLSPFWMSRTEVTQAQWIAVMGSDHLPADQRGDDLPVEFVTWSDAVLFCNRWSEKEGLEPAYQVKGDRVTWNRHANGYRLPTEAEWEFAARGGAQSRGYRYCGSDQIDDVSWVASNSGRGAHPVAQKRSNELGLYDLGGNAWEWCWDWYGLYTAQAQQDPAGPDQGFVKPGQGAALPSGPIRQNRGGGWSYDASATRPSSRFYAADFRPYQAGLRVVRSTVPADQGR